MAEPFDTAKDVVSRQRLAIIESVSVPGQPAQVVCNPDGSNISGGGGGGTVNQGTGGLSPWLFKIDQTGTNNDVDANIRDSAGAAITLGQKPMATSVPVTIASNQSAIPVSISASATALTPSSGQVNVAAGPVATPLAGVATQVDEVIIIAKIGNVGSIFLGDSTVTTLTGMEMEQGRGVSLESVDLSTVFIIGAAGDGVTFFSLT